MTMARISRRRFLKLSGSGAVATKIGGIGAILSLKRTPAYVQGTTVHWLRWNDFVSASDEVLRKVIAPECEKALGIELNIEMINGNDIQARTTSAIQSGTGPDVICALNNWAQLYPESVQKLYKCNELASGSFIALGQYAAWRKHRQTCS